MRTGVPHPRDEEDMAGKASGTPAHSPAHAARSLARSVPGFGSAKQRFPSAVQEAQLPLQLHPVRGLC